jgi:Tfp pilus assembly protein PilO
MPVPVLRVSDQIEQLLDELGRVQQRETQLEVAYLQDRATAAELQELEHVRLEIDRCLEALDGLGYFNLS